MSANETKNEAVERFQAILKARHTKLVQLGVAELRRRLAEMQRRIHAYGAPSQYEDGTLQCLIDRRNEIMSALLDAS